MARQRRPIPCRENKEKYSTVYHSIYAVQNCPKLATRKPPKRER
jgi:hypothetical protein